jgi:hypothetical protein
MIALLACLMLGPGDLPVEVRWNEDGRGTEGFLRLRAGAWACRGFSFEAVRPDATKVKIDDEVVPSAGVDLGFTVAERFLVFVSGDYSGTDHLAIPTFGACIGYRDLRRPDSAKGVPDEVLVYAGAFWSSFEVDTAGFGDFEDAVGFRAGLALTWRPSRTTALSAVGEYRLVEYDYEPEILEGDHQAGGSGAWGGLAFDFRF